MTKATRVARGLADLVKRQNSEIALHNIFDPILQHNHPPLEFLVVVPTVPLQPREFWARLVYVLISIGTLVGSYLFVKRRRGKNVAIVFLGLFSFSSYVLAFSQTITFGLNIVAGVLLALTISSFCQKTTENSLKLLLLSQVFGLWVSMDFIFFLPWIAILTWAKRRRIARKNIFKHLFLFLLLTSIFWLPYTGYSFLPISPKGAGFNYILHRNAAHEDLLTFVHERWNYFFGHPGILIIWPFSILAVFLLKKIEYIRYYFLIILTFFLIEMPAVVCCTPYLNIFGMLILLAAEGIHAQKRFGKILAAVVISGSALITVISLFKPISSTIYPLWFRKDNIKQVGKIAKECLTGDETYISTEDAWRTTYYFGRGMLPALEGETITDEQAVQLFFQKKLPYEISLVHINRPLIDETSLKELHQKAQRVVTIGEDTVFIFKDC